MLRVKGESGRSDWFSYRLRVETLLAMADLSQSGPQSSTILCIRRLHDPMPGVLNLGHQNVGLQPRWQHAFESAIENLGRHAVRPIRESAPPNAESVLFADRSELLACLAIDWLAGELVTHWWWKCLFPISDLGRLAVTAWLEAPESVPAAFDLLARLRKLPEFLHRMNEKDVNELQHKLIFTFGLRSLQNVIEEIATNSSIRVARAVSSGGAEKNDPVRSVGRDQRTLYSRFDPPWRKWVMESGLSDIEPLRQSLAGVGLMLHRAPAIVRTLSFASEVLRWVWPLSPVSSTIAGVSEFHLESNQATPDVDDSFRPESTMKNSELFHRESANGDHQHLKHENRGSVSKKSAGSPVTPDLAPAANSPDPDLSAVSGTGDDSYFAGGIPFGRTKVESRDESASSVSTGAQLPIDAIHSTREEEKSDVPDEVLTATHEESGVVVQQAEGTTPPDVGPSSVQDNCLYEGTSTDSRAYNLQPSALAEDLQPLALSADLQPVALVADRIETKLGGLFYLINAGLALNIYADFTRPLEPGLDLSIWEFVELVGRRLLAGKSKLDPVWTLLARLAGRKGEQPGRFFEPPDDWRIPPDWLVPFPGESVWKWSTSSGRLRVSHPEGFCIVDIMENGDVHKCLHEEMNRYEGLAAFTLQRIESPAVQAISKLDRWLDWFVPFLSARLRRGMRLERGRNPANVLLKHNAHVEAGDARLDIYFSLDELPIQVRIAGLDRDPGWVPAAGRYVAFHYD